MEYYPATHYTLRVGGKSSYLRFNPNILQLKGNNFNQRFNEQYANQAGLVELYLENDFRTGVFHVNVGGRFSSYFSDGKQYLDLQPRLAGGVGLGGGYSLTASYMKMTQYLHLLTNSSLGLPTDLWVASTGKVRPGAGYQLAIGLGRDLMHGYKIGVEGYYKSMNHVIRFEEGETFMDITDNNWEENVLVGEGRAYGGEFFLEKTQGRSTGMLSYTLAWSDNRFSEINRGQ